MGCWHNEKDIVFYITFYLNSVEMNKRTSGTDLVTHRMYVNTLRMLYATFTYAARAPQLDK